MTQFSLFGADAAAPELLDLEGLLVAGGSWVRAGATARLSVVVADSWRVTALAAEFAARGVDGPPGALSASGGRGVRTAFTADLLTAASRWSRGANRAVPPGFALSAGGLRLWTIAAGRRDASGYLLTTVPSDDPLHQHAGAALARLGVAAVSLSRRAACGWRVTSNRRLRRLAELVGSAPDGADADWPAPMPG